MIDARADLPALERDALGSFDATTQREWLVTNGLGGYACGTLAWTTTRRYHGLLVAALRPPVERTVLVAKLDVFAHYQGRRTALTSNEYLDGTVDPHGWRNLTGFRLEGSTPVWTWTVGDAVIEARLWMPRGRNTTCIAWRSCRGSAPLALEIEPLCTYRDYHWQLRGARDFQVAMIDGGVVLTAHAGARPCRIHAPQGRCTLDPSWHWNLCHRHERERGLDDGEDLFRPARFELPLADGGEAVLILDAEPAPPAPAELDYAVERARQTALIAQAGFSPAASEPAWLRQLVLAADQFIVERHDGAGRVLGETVIAGYPWFSDWGRDTMIALPGLTLATGRLQSAASILRTFARFVDQGLLPNVFPDSGDLPEYHTVDATLWYFLAVETCWQAGGDRALVAELYPVLAGIIDWHRRGTRHGIRVDPADGLLRAGEPGVQLTWMDARVGDHVITPRIGKPVEINALWFNALKVMQGLAGVLGRAEDADAFAAAATGVATSFNARFWYAAGDYLYDVIDGPEGEPDAHGRRRDASLRPNQIFAVSLPHALLDPARARAVVRRCARELWTPVGLRSLAAGDPRYVGHYGGSPAQRDAAYHQGTVWSWLLGPFAIAHLRAFGDAPNARAHLAGIGAHLREACIGQVSEIMDGDPPHTPRGCFAQAWSVAETLRAWRQCHVSSRA
ncbi:MAG: glycogen debranching enzyme family protein [Gammaproteobacteria bacterium]|nr:glycogen debranching enzyme family protein [Gammaproteobacteria bacterium]